MQHELGSEAFAFIREELSAGGLLSVRLLLIPPEGRVIAILPANTAPPALTDFESGDVATSSEADELAELIRVSLTEVQGICVFEHPTSRLGDPRMPQVDFFTVGVAVHPFLTTRSDHGTIVKAARESHWYPSIGVISRLGSDQPFPEPGSAMTESFLDDLATQVDTIIVGAYDAESWLLWYPEASRGNA
jgi:hypothetical protein